MFHQKALTKIKGTTRDVQFWYIHVLSGSFVLCFSDCCGNHYSQENNYQ